MTYIHISIVILSWVFWYYYILLPIYTFVLHIIINIVFVIHEVFLEAMIVFQHFLKFDPQFFNMNFHIKTVKSYIILFFFLKDILPASIHHQGYSATFFYQYLGRWKNNGWMSCSQIGGVIIPETSQTEVPLLLFLLLCISNRELEKPFIPIE